MLEGSRNSSDSIFKYRLMHPTFHFFGNFELPAYSVMVFLGFLTGGLVMLYFARRRFLNLKDFIALFLFTTVVALLGGKLYLMVFYMIKDFSHFWSNPIQILKISKGGGVFYGGLVAGFLFAVWYIRRFNMDIWETFDIVGVGIPIGHAVGRIGCFLGGCCYGRECDLPWAVQFPKLPNPVHPTQLYEAGLNTINFVFLLLLYRRRRFKGQIASLFFINYGIIRFVVEYFRGGPGRGYVFTGPTPLQSLSIPQLISLFLLGFGIFLYTRRKKRCREREYPSHPTSGLAY
jgi:phosphatidylglycerol:prolipoprotein diacylglycerol transferase